MQRWLLLLPFLLLPLACDDNSNPPAMPSGGGGAVAGSSCVGEGAHCAGDECCGGLACNSFKHICQNNGTCGASGAACNLNADCCGTATCNGGICTLPSEPGAVKH